MLRRLAGCGLALVLLAGCASTKPDMAALAPSVQSSDVYVRVKFPQGGEDVVTRAEFEQTRDKLGMQQAPEEFILDFLASRRLLLHEARLKDVSADPKEVDQFFERIKTQTCTQAPFPEAQTEKDPNKLIEACAKFFGFENSAGLRRYLQEQIVVENLMKQEAQPASTATAAPTQQSENLEETHSAHILVQTEDEAKKVRERVTTGKEDFAKVANEVSIDPSAKQNGGDLGFTLPGRLVPPFEQAAAALKPGEISQPVQTDFGWHVIKLIERRKASPEAVQEAQQQAEQMRQQAEQQAEQQAFNTFRTNMLEKAKSEGRLEYLYTPKPAPTQLPPVQIEPAASAEPGATSGAADAPPETTATTAP